MWVRRVHSAPWTEDAIMPQVNIRTSSERLAVIDRAAAAIEILSERPVIALDDKAWGDFVAALDAPVVLDPAVKARYTR